MFAGRKALSKPLVSEVIRWLEVVREVEVIVVFVTVADIFEDDNGAMVVIPPDVRTAVGAKSTTVEFEARLEVMFPETETVTKGVVLEAGAGIEGETKVVVEGTTVEAGTVVDRVVTKRSGADLVVSTPPVVVEGGTVLEMDTTGSLVEDIVVVVFVAMEVVGGRVVVDETLGVFKRVSGVAAGVLEVVGFAWVVVVVEAILEVIEPELVLVVTFGRAVLVCVVFVLWVLLEEAERGVVVVRFDGIEDWVSDSTGILGLTSICVVTLSVLLGAIEGMSDLMEDKLPVVEELFIPMEDKLLIVESPVILVEDIFPVVKIPVALVERKLSVLMDPLVFVEDELEGPVIFLEWELPVVEGRCRVVVSTVLEVVVDRLLFLLSELAGGIDSGILVASVVETITVGSAVLPLCVFSVV